VTTAGVAGFLHLPSSVVQQGANLTEDVTNHEIVANAQGSALHQDGGHRAPPLLEMGVDDRARRQLGRIRLEVLKVGNQQDHLEQLRQTRLLLGRHRHHDRLSTPFLGDESLFGQALLDPVRIRSFLVDLVDGDDDRDLGGLGV